MIGFTLKIVLKVYTMKKFNMEKFNMEKFITQIKLYLSSVLLSSIIVIAINICFFTGLQVFDYDFVVREILIFAFLNSLFQIAYMALLIIIIFLLNFIKSCLFMITNNLILYSWVSIFSLFLLTINYARPRIGLLSSESFTLILPIFVLFSWILLYDLGSRKTPIASITNKKLK